MAYACMQFKINFIFIYLVNDFNMTNDTHRINFFKL